MSDYKRVDLCELENMHNEQTGEDLFSEWNDGIIFALADDGSWWARTTTPASGSSGSVGQGWEIDGKLAATLTAFFGHAMTTAAAVDVDDLYQPGLHDGN